jgi:NAD-dependent SIR2 family protein deacetylase
LQCIQDCKGEVWSADAFFPEIDANACRIVSEMPRCPYCGAIARPNILMFGDWSWNSQRSDGQRASQSAWLQSVDDALASVAIVEIGAGSAIPSVRHFSHQQIRERGAKLVRINPREPSVPSSRDVGFASGATSVLLQMKAMI